MCLISRPLLIVSATLSLSSMKREAMGTAFVGRGVVGPARAAGASGAGGKKAEQRLAVPTRVTVTVLSALILAAKREGKEGKG